MQILSSYNSVIAESPKFRFYYGPVEDKEEFMFTVVKLGKLVYSVENSVLLNYALGERPVDMFLAGMVLYAGR